jgi:hypothetical protein
MIKRSIYLASFVAMAALAMSCGDSKKEKELQNKIAELESKLETTQPTSNSTTPEVEVKPEGPLPAFEFTDEEYNFGDIKEGEEVEKTFKFKNVGDAPLIISSAKASCGCTVPKWPSEPIGIGETGEIVVRFNSQGKSGIQNKTVTITANTYPSTSRLKISSNVISTEKPAE